MTLVKICGITNLDDALLAVKFGADALGLNFYEKSPRHISIQTGKDIAIKLPRDVTKVGVFVNEESSRIGELVDLIGLDAVQLHGNEDVAFVNELRRRTDVKIIKAFRVSSDFESESVFEYQLDGVLLDAFSPDLYGGSGSGFDWEIARAVASTRPDLYLAGGLTAENVADAIAAVRPYAVDVASGVELAKGVKDSTKLEAFITNAKRA